MSEWQVVLEKLNELGSGIKDLKQDMAEIKQELDKVEQRLDKVEQRLDKVEQRQDTIFEQTAGLLEFRQVTEKTLNQILEQQISIVHIIGEHDVCIRTLQRRIV